MILPHPSRDRQGAFDGFSQLIMIYILSNARLRSRLQLEIFLNCISTER